MSTPIPVYVWNADQDVCLASFVLEHYSFLKAKSCPAIRHLVQFNNKIDICGGLYPVDLDEMVQNHYTWVFEPCIQQRVIGKTPGDEGLIKDVIVRRIGSTLTSIKRVRWNGTNNCGPRSPIHVKEIQLYRCR